MDGVLHFADEAAVSAARRQGHGIQGQKILAYQLRRILQAQALFLVYLAYMPKYIAVKSIIAVHVLLYKVAVLA